MGGNCLDTVTVSTPKLADLFLILKKMIENKAVYDARQLDWYGKPIPSIVNRWKNNARFKKTIFEGIETVIRTRWLRKPRLGTPRFILVAIDLVTLTCFLNLRYPFLKFVWSVKKKTGQIFKNTNADQHETTNVELKILMRNNKVAWTLHFLLSNPRLFPYGYLFRLNRECLLQ